MSEAHKVTYPDHDLLLHVIHDGVPILRILRGIFRDQILEPIYI
jgi:hypothetical protein